MAYLKSRTSANEIMRLESIISMMPQNGKTALDAGAKDGFHTARMAKRFEKVTALDLSVPEISIENVECVSGDIRKLQFDDNFFDMVLCAEVLEHIPPEHLETACNELKRVTKKYLLIGVPYKQDTRIGRLKCRDCGKVNPPWGHVNEFDKESLLSHFPGLKVEKIDFVAKAGKKTNRFCTFLRDTADNPYGTYHQSERCIFCNAKMVRPEQVSVFQKALCFTADTIDKVQNRLIRKEPHWIHVLFIKDSGM